MHSNFSITGHHPMMHLYKKYIRPRWHEVSAGVIIAIAVTIRIFLIAQEWPTGNSDEAAMGLEAMHIAFRGEHPVFLYGQNYMGVLEAYIGAVLFHLFGTSLFALRLGLILLFALFLLTMYALTRFLYSKNLALITLALLCFGSSENFTREIKALGGAAETLLFGALSLLLASWLAYSFHLDTKIAGQSGQDQPLEPGQPSRAKFLQAGGRTRRYLLYACLGLVMGLGIWSHMLILPFVAMALLLLLLFCYREILTPALLCLLLGLCIGALPMLIFNVQHPAQNSILALLHEQSSGGTGVAFPFSKKDSILGTVLVSIPEATGASPLCPLSTTTGQWRHQISSCMIFQGAWGLGFFILLASAIIVALIGLRGWRQALRSQAPLEERQRIVRHTTHLLLLGSVVLTLLAYVPTSAPALVPLTSARYLVGLLVATPALIAPLYTAIHSIQRGSLSSALRSFSEILRWSVLLFIAIILVNGTIGVFQQAPDAQKTFQQQQMLINSLLRVHATHIYSDYWTCNVLIFESKESIICGALNEQLRITTNRYPAYLTLVKQDAHAAYVFSSGSVQDQAFARKLTTSRRHYTHSTAEGYTIYQPVT
jgi:4-amino-4-deoxy-L-arabinose transferase-like glycosyltransferase